MWLRMCRNCQPITWLELRRTRSVLTASRASVNMCGASPSTCAYHPFFTMFQSACVRSAETMVEAGGCGHDFARAAAVHSTPGITTPQHDYSCKKRKSSFACSP